MRGRVWIMAVVLCGVLIACKGSSHHNVAAAPVDRCAHRMSVGACVVSAVELFSAPDAFEGRSVSVVLFYPGHGAKVLFASHDSAEINDLASAIVFSRVADEQEPLFEAGYYRVEAIFQRSPKIVVGDGVVPEHVVAGRFADLENVERLRTLTGMREFCAEYKDCSISYSDGVLPIPRTGPAINSPGHQE